MESEMIVLRKALGQLLNQPLTQARASMASMFILDFGQLVEVVLETAQGQKSFFQGKGSFWAWQAPWYFRKSGKILCDSKESSTNEIAAFVESLVGLKPIQWEVTDLLGMSLTFENSCVLSLSPRVRAGDVLWTLAARGVGEFIADSKALILKKFQ